MRKIVTLSLLCLALVVSCKKSEKVSPSDALSENEKISVLDTLQLQLNEGNKWIANVETHDGVKQMDAIISVFKNESKKDYKVLGDSLAKQTSYIIKNCSMKGEPHDQLHVVLVPMLDEISILREQANPSESIAALHRLEQLIAAYFLYFNV